MRRFCYLSVRQSVKTQRKSSIASKGARGRFALAHSFTSPHFVQLDWARFQSLSLDKQPRGMVGVAPLPLVLQADADRFAFTDPAKRCRASIVSSL
jgi:hypothetical protein